MRINWEIILIHLINPFFGFIIGIKNFAKRKYQYLVLMFCLFFSYTYIPIDDSDAIRYEERISQIGDYTFTEYVKDISSIYSTESLYKDCYIYTVFYLVGKFTNDPKVFRLVFGFVYFSIFLGLILNINRLVENGKKVYLVGVIFLLNFTSGINGVRWPLSLMVFLLGVVLYISKGEFRYLLLILLSFLIHFISYFFIPFVIIYITTRKYYKSEIIIYLIIVVFLFSQFLISNLLTNINILGNGLEETTTGYLTDESFYEQRTAHLEKLNWYVVLNRFSTYYLGFACLILFVLIRNKIKKNSLILNLEYLSILMYLASYLSSSVVDPLSNRYYLAANAMVLIYLFCLSSLNGHMLIVKVVSWLFYPVVGLTILLVLRADLYTISPNLIFGNWFFELFYSYNEGIQTIINK